MLRARLVLVRVPLTPLHHRFAVVVPTDRVPTRTRLEHQITAGSPAPRPPPTRRRPPPAARVAILRPLDTPTLHGACQPSRSMRWDAMRLHVVRRCALVRPGRGCGTSVLSARCKTLTDFCADVQRRDEPPARRPGVRAPNGDVRILAQRRPREDVIGTPDGETLARSVAKEHRGRGELATLPPLPDGGTLHA